MNMKHILSAAVVIAGLSGAVAMAESSAPATAPAAATTPDKEQKREENFAEHKAKALERLEKRAAAVQEKKTCVQAATTPDALKACFPNRGKWQHGEGKKHKGEGKPDEGAAAAPEAPAKN
jgi:Flp pilus assembly protein CpaB